MPFYEYECKSCKYYTEVMQKITAAPLTRCPSCGKRTLKKLLSAPVFRLKGSGWYETDFKSDKENKRNLLAERDEAKPPAGGTETKSEATAAKETPAAKDSKEGKDSKEDKDSKPAAREPAVEGAGRARVSVPVKGSTPARRRAARRGGTRTQRRKRRR